MVEPRAFIAIEHTELLQLISYNPETGVLRWRVRVNSNTPAGSIAGTPNKGYVQISVKGRTYRAHRLAVFYMTGEWPVGQVDHEDRDRMNNRWLNLRPANSQQNAANTGPRSTNKLGVKGVCYIGPRDRYLPQITVNGEHKSLGYCKTLEEAAARYDAAHKAAFGEFSHAAA